LNDAGTRAPDSVRISFLLSAPIVGALTMRFCLRSQRSVDARCGSGSASSSLSSVNVACEACAANELPSLIE